MKWVFMRSKVALVTGTTLGVGNSLVTKLYNNGYTVIATSRNPEHLIKNKESFGWGDEVLIEDLELTDLKSIKLLYRKYRGCLLYTSPSPRDRQKSRMPSSA